jgi:hypothetical protein
MALDGLDTLGADAFEEDDDDVLARTELGLVEEFARVGRPHPADEAERVRRQERRPKGRWDCRPGHLASDDGARMRRVGVADL